LLIFAALAELLMILLFFTSLRYFAAFTLAFIFAACPLSRQMILRECWRFHVTACHTLIFSRR